MPRATVKNTDVPNLLASLAEKHGIRPSDVLTFGPALPALRKAGVDPARVSPATLHHAGGLWRAGIAESFATVDAMNAAVLRGRGDMDSVAVNGDVRLAKVAVVPAKPAKPREPAQHRGIEILGLPSADLIRAMGRAGFTFAAVRAALDELGGLGIRDATVRHNLVAGCGSDPEMTPEQLAELEPFRDAPPPPPKERPRPIEAVALATRRLRF